MVDVTIHKEFIENTLPKLTGGSVKLYLYLKSAEGMYDPEEVAKKFDVSRRTVQNWIDELTAHGLIGEKKEVIVSEVTE